MEARRRARARRDGQQDATQPLRDYLAAQTAGLLSATPDDRVLTLEALRQHADEHERLAERRRELRRR